MNKIEKYSTYKSGLRIGDMVSYENYIFGKKFGSGYEETAIVLERSLLFKKDTRYGIKSFYEYKMLNINQNVKKSQKHFYVKTQNMQIKNITTAKQR